MPERPHTLEISLNDTLVGTITNVPGDKNSFAFDPAYRANDERPTLSLGFLADTGGLVDDVPTTNARLPPYFSNLLPEGKLRDYVAEAADIHPQREFLLLWALGKDLPGAIKVRALGMSQQDEAKDADVRRAETSPLKFSLAGVQLKFSALASATGGMTVPVNGLGGDWILKLPSMTHEGVSENEFVMLGIAAALGIETPDRRLLDPSEIQGLPEDVGQLKGKALAVRRYDRPSDGARVHQEDFAQIFNQYPEQKYKNRNFSNIAAVITDQMGFDAGLEFVRRQIFNAIIGNGDMHLKNWSLVYPDGKTPKLAPAYDYLSTIPYIPSDKLALNFGGSKDFFPVDRERSKRFADKARLPAEAVWTAVEETSTRTWDEWKRSPAAELIPGDVFAKIDEHVEQSMARFDVPYAKPMQP
ncbi:HipA domain-containing protein [Tardiphaga sp. 285_C5_N1_2]|uniref:type II toxin-antitoxin system HipA family toxin n=1 Tax=Tardiphaga sp. 285_C5_N1_2 TaxID=3240775 RepID=UPI003F8A6871